MSMLNSERVHALTKVVEEIRTRKPVCFSSLSYRCWCAHARSLPGKDWRISPALQRERRSSADAEYCATKEKRRAFLLKKRETGRKMTFIESRIEEMLRCKEKEKGPAFKGTPAANHVVLPDWPPGSGVEKFLLIRAAVSEQAREA